MTERDRLYETAITGPGDFVFDEAVAAVFPDMIKRSVPGYPAIINMIQLLAERYAQPGSAVLDLGCSLGASSVALALGCAGRDCRVTGVDNAPAMLERAQSFASRIVGRRGATVGDPDFYGPFIESWHLHY